MQGQLAQEGVPDGPADDGATVSGVVTVSAQIEETVASISFMVDDVALGLPDTAVPYETSWDTTKASNGTHPQGHGRGRDREVLGPRAPRRRLQRDDATAAPGRHRAPVGGAHEPCGRGHGLGR